MGEGQGRGERARALTRSLTQRRARSRGGFPKGGEMICESCMIVITQGGWCRACGLCTDCCTCEDGGDWYEGEEDDLGFEVDGV